MAKLMVQGTASHVGKSLMVAGLCRYFHRQGLRVNPFKPQNMSNNAAVASDGGEIGRAQALQARAAGVAPSRDMNPILLKPEGDSGAQVIVKGKLHATMSAVAYTKTKAEFLPTVLDSFARLEAKSDIVIVEGAGSPAEVNLRAGDIANMGFAEAAQVPVVLVGDIERGGVIAALVGSHAVMSESDRKLIKGFIINKFRGEAALLGDAMQLIEGKTGWQNLGLLPWFDRARYLPAEDSLGLAVDRAGKGIGNKTRPYHIAVPILPKAANMDDLDPLRLDPAFRVSLVEGGQPLPLDADMVLLAGSKTTIADLAYFRAQGWEADLQCLHRHGVLIVGLCGGYQMLGQTVADPHGMESGGKPADAKGLGLLAVTTDLLPTKTTTAIRGTETSTGVEVVGYEIHLGKTTGADTARPMLMTSHGKADGAVSGDGRVMGCYMHGLFASDEFRQAWLKKYGGGATTDKPFAFEAAVDDALNNLAGHIAHHCDMATISRIAGL